MRTDSSPPQVPYAAGTIPIRRLAPKHPSVKNSPIHFGNNRLKQASPLKLPGLLKFLDFNEVGWSHVNQIQIVYAACILWRLVAANERRKASPSKSWNEMRESILRDSVGYAFWFFGVPTMQRIYLMMIPKDIKKVLLQPTRAQDQGSLWGTIKKWNPITGYAIPTSEQVRDMKTQTLQSLEERNFKPTELGYQRVEAFYEKLVMHRNLATGLGLLSTVLLLGIGINAFNMYLTKRNVAKKGPKGLKEKFPTPPPLPTVSPSNTAKATLMAPTIPLTTFQTLTGAQPAAPYPTNAVLWQGRFAQPLQLPIIPVR